MNRFGKIFEKLKKSNNFENREKLSAHLPADSSIPKTEAELKDTLRSPQFQQACDAFSRKFIFLF